MLSDRELLLLNSQGFIPGPKETEEDFLKRVASVKSTFEKGEWIPRPHWEWVKAHLREIFDFEPHSLPAFYSNRGLTPWQGAASWIKDGKLVSVQLREALRKGSYLGYSREEILAHEAVHAARSAFEEPKAEEFFAYMVSEKSWRRVLGPIVQRPWEVWVFLIAVLLGICSSLGHLLGILWIGVGFGRLIRQHIKLRRSSENLLKELGDKGRTRAVLLRLTDEEISRFSKGESIFSYAEKEGSLRWKLIRLAYLMKSSKEVSCG